MSHAQPDTEQVHDEAPGPRAWGGGYHVAFWALTAAALALSLYLALWAGLELVADEAYYWVWSRHPDWCYFSKGPGIAVLIRFGTALAGDSELGVRLPALICATATGIVFFYWLRAAAGSERVAFWAVAAMVAAPVMTAGRFLATIDGPLFLCWTLAIVLLWRLSGPRPRLIHWCLLGLLIAAGTLVKFTMLLFVPAVAVALVLLPQMRREVRRPGPWLMLALAALGLVPIIIFNLRHDWVTLTHNVEKTGREWGWWKTVLSSLGLQIAVIGPLLFALCAWGVIALTRRAVRDRDRFAVVLSAGWLPVFVPYGLLAWKVEIAPNWPVVGYATGFAAMAAAFAGPAADRTGRALLLVAVVVSLAMQVPFYVDDVVYHAASAAGLSPRRVAKIDQTNRLRGWSELAARVTAEADALEAAGDASEVAVLSDNYQYTSEMKFYVRGALRVGYIPRATVQDQYGLWPPIALAPGADVILVSKAPQRARDAFESVERLEPFILHRQGFPVKKVRLFRARGFKGWKTR